MGFVRHLIEFGPALGFPLAVPEKTGDERWYEKFVPIADRLFERHLGIIQAVGPDLRNTPTKGRSKAGTVQAGGRLSSHTRTSSLHAMIRLRSSGRVKSVYASV